MEKTRLQFLLMGKTGEGKSATGNMIINRRMFKTSCKPISGTKLVSLYFAEFGEYVLRVVDGLGLKDTNMDKVQDMETAVENVDMVLHECHGGVDAFLLVIKFGNRFTEKDKGTLEALSQIYGVGFMKHVVVVVTGGDLFQTAVENEETPDQDFHEWCREQEGAFKKLYEDCEGRFVLFNNNEKDEEKKRAQVEEVVQLAHDLQKRSGRYTSDSFKKAEYEREKTILQLKAPHLKEEFQEKICLLSRTIEDLCTCARTSNDKARKVRVRVHDLRKEIELHDKGYKVLEELLEKMTNIEEHLHDMEKLKALNKELEEIRQAMNMLGRLFTLWTGSGVVTLPCAVAIASAGILVSGGLLAPLIASLAIGGAIRYGIEYWGLKSKEKKKEQQLEHLKNTMKPQVTEPQTHKY